MKFSILAFAALALAGDAPFVAAGDRVVDAKVHQQRARLRLDPGAPSMPVFNPDFASRAGFRSGFIGTMAVVGPVRVHGQSAVIRLDLGDGEFKRRVTWFAAPFTQGADGIVGPGALPASRVRFDLHPAQPGERSATLPLADFGAAGMGVRIPAGERTIDVYFTLESARSLATAVAGAAIAGGHGGKFDREPEKMDIQLGVVRPVRHLALATPFAVGPLALSEMMVRTGDFGSAGAIPDANAPVPDPDEIVVTGEKKQKPRRVKLAIGSDDLARCSSILFDKPAKTVTLSCR
ncbi:hypothetical protein AB2M62_17355 [Sphingomonas sp. MMS12-HWE2-04]|uniref:hypothetical protein n=1 Tax=Sphingomonas sp. MMS12-HWE2-04 TaxID=3234199 RepID=UPI00384FD353